MKVILVIASKDYQPVEYGVTKEVLMANNIEVVTASDAPGIAQATDESTVQVDLTIDQINPTNYDGIFLIGGAGAMEHLDHVDMYQILDQFKALGKLYGAICISPRILASAQVLGGQKATGWNEDNKLNDIFAAQDVIYVRQPVVVYGKAITAEGPTAAKEFGEAIVKKLQG